MIIVILAIVFFLVMFFLIIVGLVIKPKIRPINIFANTQNLGKRCNAERTSCRSTIDCLDKCLEAQSGEEMVCKQIPPVNGLTPTLQTVLGGVEGAVPPSYCVPANATMSCDVRTGGIPVFTGWSTSGLQTQGFDCMCAYPLWASSRTCENNGACHSMCQLNPGICSPGSFNWDLTMDSKEPNATMCQCDPGYEMVVDTSGLPRCVKNAGFYSDTDKRTRSVGGQGLVPLDNTDEIVIDPIVYCPTGNENGASMVTKCTDGCCPIPNGVCCGNQTCCPTGTVCDNTDFTCKKSSSTCTNTETVCSGGCCPVVGGRCCPDNKTCCPPTFPNCDVDRQQCNPNPVLLTPADTAHTGVNCLVGGYCPLKDGVCSGDGIHCCPKDYPNYDSTLGCRKKAT